MREKISYIASIAKQRKVLVINRTEKAATEGIDKAELITQSALEVELFDAIDSLQYDEFSTLVEIAEVGGLIMPDCTSLSEQVDLLYLQLNLDLFLIKGLERKSKI